MVYCELDTLQGQHFRVDGTITGDTVPGNARLLFPILRMPMKICRSAIQSLTEQLSVTPRPIVPSCQRRTSRPTGHRIAGCGGPVSSVMME
jgi:hypothetical protein